MALIRRRENEQGTSPARVWDPFELVQQMFRWEPFRDVSRTLAAEPFVPSFEVKETKEGYQFRADLPGIKENDLEISLTGNNLTISGQRQEEQREEGDRFYTYERSYGSFTRSFTLPDDADQDNVQAELKNGVLNLTIPKKPESQPKRVQLKRNGGEHETEQPEQQKGQG